MTPEQRVAEAMILSLRSHAAGLTVDDAIECDPCGEQFTHYAKWLARREAAHATAALDAVRDALTSDDPDVVRAMAVRIGLNVSTRTVYEAARRDSLDTDGQPTVFRFGQDRPWRILEAIRRRELGLSPETHICMGAIQTSASVSMRSPWREVPDAEA